MFDWFRKSDKLQTTTSMIDVYGAGENVMDFVGIAENEAIAPRKAMQHAAVFACVQVISSTIGALPIEVIDRQTKAVVADHKYNYMLNVEPNVFDSARVMWTQVLIDIILRGNGYCLLERNNNGVIQAIVRYKPESVIVKLADNAKNGLIYTLTHEDGAVKSYRQGDILHFKCFGDDNHIGMTPLQYAHGTIGAALRENDFVSRYYKTGGFVRNILKLGKDVSQPVKEAYKKLFKSQHTAGNAELLILSPEDEYKQESLSLQDAQTLAAREYSTTEICRFLDVPPMMIGNMQNQATFKFVSDIFIYFFRKTLKPYVEKMEAEMTRKMFGKNQKFNAQFSLHELTRGDPKTRSEFLKAAMGGNGIPGYMKIDEARKSENLPPLDDGAGDRVYYPPENLGLQPSDDEADQDDESDDDEKDEDKTDE